jgi:hypothetical protein
MVVVGGQGIANGRRCGAFGDNGAKKHVFIVPRGYRVLARRSEKSSGLGGG